MSRGRRRWRRRDPIHAHHRKAEDALLHQRGTSFGGEGGFDSHCVRRRRRGSEAQGEVDMIKTDFRLERHHCWHQYRHWDSPRSRGGQSCRAEPHQGRASYHVG